MALEEQLNTPCGQKVTTELTPEQKAELRYADDAGYVGMRPPRQDTVRAKVFNTMFEKYISSILAGPQTQGLNVVSLSYMTLTRFPETLAGVMSSSIMRSNKEKLHLTEFHSEVAGFNRGVSAAIDIMSARYDTTLGHTDLSRTAANTELGKTVGIPPELMSRSKLDSTFQYITSETYGVENSFIRPVVDFTGFAVNLPGNMLGTTDLLYKVINFHSTAAKLSMRQARLDMDQKMRDDSDLVYDQQFVDSRYATIYEYATTDPADSIYKASVKDADQRAFTGDPQSGYGKWIVNTKFPGFRWVVPLRRAIIGALESSVDHSILGIVPGMEFSRTYQELHSGSQAMKAAAVGRMASGTIIAAGIMGLLWDKLDGAEPINPYERAQWLQEGHKAYSINLGPSWPKHILFRGLGSAEAPLRAAARIKQYMNTADWDTADDSDEAVNSMFMTYAMGIADVVYDDQAGKDIYQFLSAANSSFRDEKPANLVKWIGRKYNTMLVGNAANTVKKTLDQYRHAPDSVLEGLVSRIPFMSDQVARRVDFGGNYILNSGEKDPSQSYEFTGKDSVSTELDRVHMKLPISNRTKENVKTTPLEYEQWQVYAGKGDVTRPFLYPSMQARIQRVIDGPLYSQYPSDEKRRNLILRAIKKGRKVATRLLRENPNFSYKERWLESRKAKQRMNQPF